MPIYQALDRVFTGCNSVKCLTVKTIPNNNKNIEIAKDFTIILKNSKLLIFEKHYTSQFLWLNENMESSKLKRSDDWIKVQSKSRPGRYYMFNKATGETKWIPTDGQANDSDSPTKKEKSREISPPPRISGNTFRHKTISCNAYLYYQLQNLQKLPPKTASKDFSTKSSLNK